MARPQGEIRRALAEAVECLVRERGYVVDGQAVDGVTYIEVAERSLVGYTAAQETMKNMRRAGHLAVIGRRRAAHSAHWMALYVPRHLAGPQAEPVPDLASAIAVPAWWAPLPLSMLAA